MSTRPREHDWIMLLPINVRGDAEADAFMGAGRRLPDFTGDLAERIRWDLFPANVACQVCRRPWRLARASSCPGPDA